MIWTAGRITCVAEYISEGEGLSIVDDLGWGLCGSDVQHVIPILERCTELSVEWDRIRGLQFDTAKMEAALLTPRRGHTNHRQPKLRAK